MELKLIDEREDGRKKLGGLLNIGRRDLEGDT